MIAMGGGSMVIRARSVVVYSNIVLLLGMYYNMRNSRYDYETIELL